MLLPYADMAIAAIVGIWVSVYLRIARRANVRTLLMGSLGFFAINCLAFWYSDSHLGRALADAGPLHLGGHVRGRGAGPGVDPGQLRPDHA